MTNGAVEIDDDMPTDADVDGQDRMCADDASFADGYGIGFLDSWIN